MLNTFLLVGISQAGHLGQAKQCTINVFEPNVTLPATELTKHILRHANHLNNHVGEPVATLPALLAPSAFLTSASQHKHPQPRPSGGRTPFDK
jgi:hypothetical protein